MLKIGLNFHGEQRLQDVSESIILKLVCGKVLPLYVEKDKKGWVD